MGGLFVLLLCLTVNPPPLKAAPTLSKDLTELSLEDLMGIEVTATLARKEKRVGDTAAAVFVITDEEIRRSGATCIPDLLRMVPGLEVARIDANQWAVTARGFNGVFANKLLVLMDGRSVYTPLYSGVYWDVQDTMMEDIARIEVIRGPGASLWGANAVNGVINIITKQALETQGGLVAAGAGTEEKLFYGARYGGRLGASTHYRIYAKGFERDGGYDAADLGVEDHWNAARGGGRVDWAVSDNNQFTLQGDYYEGGSGTTGRNAFPYPPYVDELNDEIDVSGGNLIGRWQRTFSPTSELILKTYYDRTQRKYPLLEEVRDTIDLDLQHRFNWTDRQEVIWGFGYRLSHAKFDEGLIVNMGESDGDNLFSFFVQDEIYIVPRTLSVLLGSKFEKNSYTDWEVQPNLRLLWLPDSQQTLWASISKAVRTPSLAENQTRLVQQVDPGPPVTLFILQGNEDFVSEELLAYEVGYRYRPLDTLSMDLALFYNQYDHLRTIEFGEPILDDWPTYIYVPLNADNKLHGYTYGAELSVEYHPLDWWRLYVAYTYMEMELEADEDSSDMTWDAIAGESPRHQFSLRSLVNVGSHWQVDLWARFVDELAAQDIPGYITLDARLGWRPTSDLEVSLVGQNLLDDHHAEFSPEIVDFYTTEVERSVYVKMVWQF